MIWLYHNEHEARVFTFEEAEVKENEGWVDTPDKLEPVQTLDRELLKKEADDLGIEYPSNVKTDRLVKLIAEAKGE